MIILSKREMNFNTGNVSESTSKYLRPGIENKVIIDNVIGQEPKDRAPFIEFTFRKPESSSEEATRVRFYMSEKAVSRSMQKIVHIATKVCTREQLNALTATTVEEYGAMLNRLLRNKALRLMFSPEQYVNAKGEVKVKPTLGLPEFAEAINTGAEYAPVADGETKLKYDEDKLMIKVKESSVPKDDSAVVNNDLPF